MVLEGAIPPVPVVRGPGLPVADGVLLPPVDAGADVCATAIAAAKHTTVARISTVLLIEFSCLGFGSGMTRGCALDARNRRVRVVTRQLPAVYSRLDPVALYALSSSAV